MTEAYEVARRTVLILFIAGMVLTAMRMNVIRVRRCREDGILIESPVLVVQAKIEWVER